MADCFNTITDLKALKPRSQPYEARDTQVIGGYVRVLQSGNVSYLFRYKFNKKSHKLFLGRFVLDVEGLAEARIKAREAANELTRARGNPSGIDPLTARQRSKNPSQSDLVKHLVDQFVEQLSIIHFQ